jgi:hypothetical protein
MKRKVTVLLAALIVSVGLGIFSGHRTNARAQETSAQPRVLTDTVVDEPLEFDVSPPLGDLPVVLSEGGALVIHPLLRPKLQPLEGPVRQGTPPAGGELASSPGPLISATISLNFDGVGQNATNNCPVVSGSRVAPADTNAAVGDTQVVQWVNVCYAVFDKTTGARIAGPFRGNHFWWGFNSRCATSNQSDPIIQWDKANHVWVASQNVFSRPYLTCIAVSKTADATGPYNRFAFSQPGFPDYPKWGLTSNVYYQTQNDFGRYGYSFVGVNVCAYDGAAMRAGTTAKRVCILDTHTFDDSMLPADNDYVPSSPTTTTPPEILLGSIDNANPGSKVYEYVFKDLNFTAGTAKLLGANWTMPITVPTFNLACGGGACINQPGVTDRLDALGDRLMYRLALFNDGTTQHYLVTHSVNNTTATAARWYEFRAPSGSTALTLYQAGQTPDDGRYRWMGSVAYDKHGDIALGYSRSSAAAGDYPSLYLSGQTAGEPSGTTDTESLIFQSSGSQTDTFSRWGDYSSMVLDGADSCSFWYTTEYYPATASFAWNTRIAKIRFSSCP